MTTWFLGWALPSSGMEFEVQGFLIDTIIFQSYDLDLLQNTISKCKQQHNRHIAEIWSER